MTCKHTFKGAWFSLVIETELRTSSSSSFVSFSVSVSVSVSLARSLARQSGRPDFIAAQLLLSLAVNTSETNIIKVNTSAKKKIDPALLWGCYYRWQ